MANERPAEKPADKPSAKPRNRSRHRSGHSLRPQAAVPAPKNRLRWTWREYVLQLSVVILGVVVTFVGSGLVERWQEQRKVGEVMSLVYEELRTNRSEMERVCRSLNYDRCGMEMLQEYEMDYRRTPVDSLKKYQYIIGRMRNFRPQQDALEVLRSSGTITAVGDKRLLFDILECYSWMTDFSAAIDKYNDQKLSSLNHLFANGLTGSIGGPDPVETWRTLMGDPMCAAFIGTMQEWFGAKMLNGGAVSKIDDALKKLGDKYGFGTADSAEPIREQNGFQ